MVSDIIFDFNVKPRLNSERGDALLVASSIHEACNISTSYNPQTKDVTKGGSRR